MAQQFVSALSAAVQQPFALVTFDTAWHGGAVYHTNVLLAIGTHVVVVCLECVVDAHALEAQLLRLRKKIVRITGAQMAEFCANILELDGRILVMSTR